MRKALSIAGLTIRTAVHSRVLVFLACVVVVVVVGFPRVVKSDGTLAGEVTLILKYSLGAAMLLIGIAALWSGAAAVSVEIKGRQIFLLRSKPVAAWQVWLGKWAGLLFLSLLVLVVSVLVTYAMVIMEVNSPVRSVRDREHVVKNVLTARSEVFPAEDRIGPMIEERVSMLLDSGALPEGISGEKILENARRDVMYELYTVAPGDSREWVFSVPPRSEGHDFVLEFKFNPSRDPTRPVELQWDVLAGGLETRLLSGKMLGSKIHQVDLPSDPGLSGSSVILKVTNLDSAGGQTILLDQENSLKLMYVDGSFEMNMFRAFLIMAFRLGLLGALGLTAGCLFSFPVASFTAFSACMLSGFASLFRLQSSILGMQPDSADADFLEKLSHVLMIVVYRAVRPVQRFDVLDMLAGGIRIPWSVTGDACFWNLIIYCGVLAGAGILVLSKREMAR